MQPRRLWLDFKCIRKSQEGVGKTNAVNGLGAGEEPFRRLNGVHINVVCLVSVQDSLRDQQLAETSSFKCEFKTVPHF